MEAYAVVDIRIFKCDDVFLLDFFVSGNLEDLYLAMSSDQPGVNSSFSPKIHQSEDKHFIKSYQGE